MITVPVTPPVAGSRSATLVTWGMGDAWRLAPTGPLCRRRPASAR
jgi:hypothetical protein